MNVVARPHTVIMVKAIMIWLPSYIVTGLSLAHRSPTLCENIMSSIT